MTTAEMTLITAGELSRRTGVSIEALRDYTDRGRRTPCGPTPRSSPPLDPHPG